MYSADLLLHSALEVCNVLSSQTRQSSTHETRTHLMLFLSVRSSAKKKNKRQELNIQIERNNIASCKSTHKKRREEKCSKTAYPHNECKKRISTYKAFNRKRSMWRSQDPSTKTIKNERKKKQVVYVHHRSNIMLLAFFLSLLLFFSQSLKNDSFLPKNYSRTSQPTSQPAATKHISVGKNVCLRSFMRV